MKLGAFSVSLSVKDISASKEFYMSLGFTQFGGDFSQNWVMLRNGDSVIGLFQGMFEGNMMTFNPGWDQNATALNDFDDLRIIQEAIVQKGVVPTSRVDQDSKGPGSFTLVDPDGNVILFDQHV